MNKKLLLINPWIYDFTAYDLWSKPLGLLYIASFLRNLGFEIRYIDCLDQYAPNDNHTKPVRKKRYGAGPYPRTVVEKPSVLKHVPRRYARYGISETAFVEQLRNHNDADAVLVTSIMTYWYLGVKHVVQLVREHLPHAPVILGGIYATLMPQHADEVIAPDHVVTGPGERKVLHILEDRFQCKTDSTQLPQSLNDYPYPAFDLVNHPDYLVIITARGCPYDCSFCAQKHISMPFTQRSPQNVVDEIQSHFHKYRVHDFAFYDDALFIGRRRHIKPILERVIGANLPVRFHSPNGLFAKLIDPELARLMYESSFKTIRLSFETSNEERRRDMYSKVNNEEMIRAVENLHQAGYRRKDIEAYVLMGLPGQPLEEVIASIIFIHNLGVQVRLASFSPIPGTQEFQRAVDEGKITANVDPLLTNKSIFPLSENDMTYENFKKARSFSHVLNQAAQKEVILFDDSAIGSTVRQVVRQI